MDLIGWLGAITGIISLGWHVFNSFPKIELDMVRFSREKQHNRLEKEVIGCFFNIKNKGNRSTTIEDIKIKIGNKIIPYLFNIDPTINANSSQSFDQYIDFTPNEFRNLFKNNKINLGVKITHTFGVLKRTILTNFNKDLIYL